MRTTAVALACLTLSCEATQAYTQSTITSNDPTPAVWDFSGSEAEIQGGRLTYRLNPAGSADIADGSDLVAIENAFRTFEGLTGTALAFARGPDSADEVVANDDIFPIFWLEDSTIIDQGTPDPSDDFDIGNSLATTFTSWWTSGPNAGQIIDSNIAFNGFDHQWTTSPEAEPTRHDIESVALHEIGHALGFGHSAVGGATMFPRTAAGNTRPRTLSRDDVAVAGRGYGDASWALSTARLSGVVRAGGTPVLGAHVTVEDSDGNAVAGTLTAADGSYQVDGLPTGALSVWIEPLDRNDGSTVLFSTQNLTSYWRANPVELDFKTTDATPVFTTAGNTSLLDLDVIAGTPSLNITLVGGQDSFLANSPAKVDQGAKDVVLRIAGPTAEMVNSGTPLSVSGGGITMKGTSYQLLSGGSLQVVALTVDVDPDAVPGLRSLIIDDGSERTIASGHLEILELSDPAADADGDTVPDPTDNCPLDPNAGQQDSDGDGAGDACDSCPDDALDDADGDGRCADVDNCPAVSNAGQQDSDGDGAGDACDGCPNDALDDADGDGRCADVDNCPAVSNAGQQDSDGDGAGDACDGCPNDALDDADGDGRCADVDNCPAVSNAGQQDSDGDDAGDACDSCPNDALDDADGDGLCADADNCPGVANAGQQDADQDGAGDACDPCPADALDDADGDGLCSEVDNCPAVANPQQDDLDGDGAGDACDICPADPSDDLDADGLCSDVDNCPLTPNPGQENLDGDAYGDACDVCPDDATDRCVSVNLLRHAGSSERSVAAIQAAFVRGQDGGLDPASDMALADIGSAPALAVAGDGRSVGDGNPGVLIFYDVENSNGFLRARRSGANVVLSGW